MVLLGLALAPLFYEGAALCIARWTAMFGPYRHVETSMLDRKSVV